jgi:putative FmdB family regulatory protein
VPRYTYRCTSCDTYLDIFHLADEEPDKCMQCNSSENLVKLLSPIRTMRKNKLSRKTGALTEEFIQDSRQELEQQKEELANK